MRGLFITNLQEINFMNDSSIFEDFKVAVFELSKLMNMTFPTKPKVQFVYSSSSSHKIGFPTIERYLNLVHRTRLEVKGLN